MADLALYGQHPPRVAQALTEFHSYANRLQKRVERQQEAHEGLVKGFLGDLSSAGAGFLSGVYFGKTGGHKFLGIPFEGFAYAILKTIAHFFGGDTTQHVLRSAATGVGTALTVRWGEQVGKSWAGGTTPTTAPHVAAGNEGQAGKFGRRLSPDELNKMYASNA